jgi:uncharacterized protein YdaU (DUF1376 family)
MSKDPAFLFYSSDFLTGTMTMTNEQVGMYIRLLCLQHQKGMLSENDMIFICKSDDLVMSKFEKNNEGFFNLRLKEEAEKRANFCKSRGINKAGKTLSIKKNKHIKNISKSYDNHMENENVNIIDNKIDCKKVKESKKLKESKELIYPPFSSKFFELWNIIIKEPNWEKKTNNALQISLNKLAKFDEQTAIKMIENSIAGGWKGIFELKEDKKKDPIKKQDSYR